MTLTDFLPDQAPRATQEDPVGQDPDFPASHPGRDTHSRNAGGDQTPTGRAAPRLTPMYPTPVLLDPMLAMAALVLDDLEKVRIANENRLRTLTASFEDGGAGLTEAHPDVKRLADMVTALAKMEHDATLGLQRAMRKHPLGPWVAAQKGVGEKQAARLLAAIGDPYINSATGQPRTVSALWAYCGLHVLPASHIGTDTHEASAGGAQTSDPGQTEVDSHRNIAGVAARRMKGQRANWSAEAKMRAYLIATSCIKHMESPYRKVYDLRRAHTAGTHPDWTPGHSHNDALRVASKEILKDLWKAARDIHQTSGDGHLRSDTQRPPAVAA